MRTSKLLITCLGSATLFLSACATGPESDPAYVSPTQYQDYNCKQISAEMNRVSAKIEQASQTEATNQVIGAAVTAFAISRGYGIGGSGDVTLKRFRNQYDVLEQTSIKKNCH